MSDDIRATALLDQLNEIDVREAAVREGRRSRWSRASHLGTIGLSLLVVQQLGVNMIVPGVFLVAVPYTVEVLGRKVSLRRLARERRRLLALYDEIDRAAEGVTR